jgi:2'-5' RNA ligase
MAARSKTVATPAEPRPVLRAFVAVELPAELRQLVAGFATGLSTQPAFRATRVRWTPPDNLHVTLEFIAHLPAALLPELHAAIDQVAAAAGGPLRLGLAGGGCFPEPRRPKVLWLGLCGDTARLASLAAAVKQSLVALGLPVEDRPFAPHLTVGRIGASPPASGIAEAFAAAAPAHGPDFVATSIALFRSETLPEGPRYTPLHRATLT